MTDDQKRGVLAGHEALDMIGPFLDTLSGMVQQTMRRGFTEEQAHAVVAYLFGFRPADGSTPDGAE